MQLLVSVRNASEAIVASRSGADIIDVKEPEQGALGFAGWDVVASVARTVGNPVVVSAAMGEYSEWLADGDDCQKCVHHVDNLQFVKLGLAGAISEALDDCQSRWDADWNVARRRVEHCLSLNETRVGWVAVAYADAKSAKSPSPTSVLTAAIAAGCRILLIDTYHKDGRTTLGWLSESELILLRSRANEAGLGFALAGQLTEQHLSSVERIKPDIFAVRGAVCESDRRSSISADKVESLKRSLEAFG